jgi:hypothetical protein
MTIHEKYIAEMKRLKASPPYMTEKQLNESLGIATEDTMPPLVITPRNQQRPMKPTIDNHDKVKKVKRIRLPKQVSEPKPKREPIVKHPKSNRAKATDLSGLTKEEKDAHFKAKALERYYAKRSPTVRVKMSDEERKRRRYEYEKKRREKLKAEGKWYRKPPTEEEKQKLKDYKTQKRRADGIMPRVAMSPEEKKARLLQQSKEWRQRCKEKGIKRTLTPEQRDRYNANQRAKAKLKKEQQ